MTSLILGLICAAGASWAVGLAVQATLKRNAMRLQPIPIRRGDVSSPSRGRRLPRSY
jgi:hypothetical protein